MKTRSDFFSILLFCISLLSLAFAYGVVVGRYEIFPFSVLKEAKGLLDDQEQTDFYISTTFSEPLPSYLPESVHPGLNLVTAVRANNQLAVYVMDMKGNILHSWDVDWFNIWPNATHLPDQVRPKQRPGTHIHGAVVLDDGDLIYNYEHLGLVRLDLCGKVIWRLPYRTHHSVHKDHDGNLWVSGQINHEEKDSRYPNHVPEFIEPVALQVSADGEIKNEISILELLRENGINGLLYMSTKEQRTTSVSGDTLHLNDVEPFPTSMSPGIFSPGDLLVSLRNINTVLVFNSDTKIIKHIWIGNFIRQHDPDFIDGETISVFDNNNSVPAENNPRSQILIFRAGTKKPSVYYSGDETFFYSDIMGKHQWLPNGNLLISESMRGRAFEIDSDGTIVWEYINLIGDGYVGLMEEVQRLPEQMYDVYSKSNIASTCGKQPN